MNCTPKVGQFNKGAFFYFIFLLLFTYLIIYYPTLRRIKK